MPINFSEQAHQVIDMIRNTNHNIFVTGKAGTGKSVLLEHIRSNVLKNIVVLAPTGISAINVNGETIHSFFKLKPGFEKAEAQKMKIDEKKQKKYQRLKIIAIDEISMVRADLLDAVDIVLRRSRNNSKPFGGVQMIFFGDLYQLPPVVTSADRDKFFSEYSAPYFFNAQLFQGQSDLFSGVFDLKVVELSKIYRQKDQGFIDILNAVRDKSVSDKHLNELNKRFFPNFVPKDEDNYIHLMTTNAAALTINSQKLAQLEADEKVFLAKKEGTIAKNLYPNDKSVSLKVGAQVMFISNDSERRWVNGTLGKVVDIIDFYDEEEGIDECTVFIEKNDGKIVQVQKQRWEISRYVFKDGNFERETLGAFTQIPLKLAWAITIHKSQGKTFEKVVIDLGRGSFAHGQTYVALSRCTSLNGLVLKKRIYNSSIIMDQRVKDFIK